MLRVESNYFSHVDTISDYTPIVSTVKSIVVLFFNYLVLPFLDEETIQNSHFYTYIEEKGEDVLRNFLLLIPIIGNIAVAILDCYKRDASDLVIQLQTEMGDTPDMPAILNDAEIEEAENVLNGLFTEPGIGDIILDYSGHPVDAVLVKLRKKEMSLSQCSRKMRGNFDVVSEVVRKHPYSFRDATPELQDNDEILRTALSGAFFSDMVFDSASERLREDPGMIALVLRYPGRSLKYADAEKKKEIPYVLKAVETDGSALQFADPTLQDNYEIVRAAVTRTPSALRYASPRLRDDEGMVRVAIGKFAGGDALGYASDRLKNDPAIVELAISNSSGRALASASDALKDNDEIVWLALTFYMGAKRPDWENYARYASPRIQAAIANGTFSWENRRPGQVRL